MTHFNAPLKTLFSSQKDKLFQLGNTSYAQRIEKLNILKKAIETTYRAAIIEALYKDLKKPRVEAELTEIHQIISSIKYAKRHLHRWMAPKKVKTPLTMLGASSYYKYESKGVCLIISPWNFPFNLTFGPLVSAIAAGNAVIIKPSEITPHCSAVMKTIVDAIFNPDEIALVEGDVATATALLELPFNHIFFTGSPKVGEIIMSAAAKHLSSVTLELGGKSPTIIDDTVNLYCSRLCAY